jgi:[ribosomal protein S5]-alanine N-acetyltransferase
LKTLHTPLCTLEPQGVVHAEALFDVLCDPAIYEFEHQPPASLPWLTARLARLESRASADGSEQWLNWVVRLPDGEVAGYVQASVPATGRASIGYELGSRFWRRGIGRAAVGAMLAELAVGYGVGDVAAVLKAANFRSAALLRSLGFGAASPAEAAGHEPEADEIVMVKPAVVGQNRS